MKAIINDNGTILTLLRKELFTSAPFKLPSKLWVESKALLIFFLKKEQYSNKRGAERAHDL